MKSATLLSNRIRSSEINVRQPAASANRKFGRHSRRVGDTASVAVAPVPSAGLYNHMISCVLGASQTAASTATASAVSSIEGKFDPAIAAGISAFKPSTLSVM